MTDRSKFLGGSDIAAILGISPWRTALDVWMEKTSIGETEEMPASRLAVLDRGKCFEPLLIEMACEELGVAVKSTNQRYNHPTLSFASCEIDADLVDGRSMEIKTVHPRQASQWGEADTDDVPDYYLAQAQWGAGVTTRDQTVLYAAIGFDDRRPYLIDRDEEIISIMFERAREFWDLVESRMPPVMDFEHAGAIKSIRRLYGELRENAIYAGDSELAWRKVFEESAALVSRYEKVQDSARAHLLDKLGNDSRLLFPDGKEFRRKLVKRKGYTVEDTQYVDFRLTNTKD